MTTDPKLLPDDAAAIDAALRAWYDRKEDHVFGSVMREHMRAAVAAYLDRRPSPWIACAERMPEPEECVLWCRVPVVEPYYIGSMLDDDFAREHTYTHWLPTDALPPPPAPEGE